MSKNSVIKICIVCTPLIWHANTGFSSVGSLIEPVGKVYFPKLTSAVTYDDKN